MKIIKNVLKSELKIRTEMDFPKKGIEFIDINPLIMDRDNLTEIIDYFVKQLKRKKLDYIIAPEARGFLFGCAVAKGKWKGYPPSYYVCCNYYPGGNYEGQYKTNVGKPK